MQNFFSFGPNAESLDLSKPGLFLILGNNGEGKSTIFDAITFALFNKVTKDVNLPDIVNESSGKDCRVELEFDIGSDTYYIERFRKHKKFRDNAYVYKNKKDKDHLISKSNKADTQELIESIIKFNYKSFVNAVMMSQENVSSFIDADPAKKKEIIENILQINVMTKYHWIAQRKRQIIGRDIENLQIHVDQLHNQIENTKSSMIEYVKSCKRQKEEAQEKIVRYESKLDELSNTDIEKEYELIKESQELATQIEKKQIEEQTCLDVIKQIEKEIENTNSTLKEYESFIDTNQSLITKTNKEIERLTISLQALSKQVDDAKENPELCPLCKNEINEHDHKLWIQEKEEEIETQNNTISLRQKEVETLQEKIETWEEKVNEYKIYLKEIQRNKSEKEQEKKKIKKEIQSIKLPDTKDESELREINSKKQELELKIKELKNKEYVDKTYLESLKNQAKSVEQNYKDKKKELTESKKKFVITEWWENSLSSKKKTMKSWCINNIIGYFNARIKFYMDRFFDGSVQLQMDTELNEIISRRDKERSFGQFSGGQKRRLNLSVLFALNSLVKANISTKINIMFLDEILSNFLDDKGISTVLELLEEMKDNGETAFIIEHRDSFKDYPAFKPIRVYQDNNEYSHIKVL